MLPGSAELLYPAQLGISTSMCKKFPLMRNPPAPLLFLYLNITLLNGKIRFWLIKLSIQYLTEQP
ncbi:MAG: hypothetical protein CVV42_16035 [Candidatus Riflebacteria bacterium HGW-Riflebacteria-2]|nr:MAG: hypothetical protein CVV42_16035 [Candidatus Riflebacteria bacterium HGW-Riflebacteria-2]